MSRLFPEIKSRHSLAAKYVTEEIWNRLCDHKTETCGFTLEQIIACAVQFDDQHVGVYAGDGDCYIDFKDVLEPVICEYHNVGEDFKHISDLDPDKITGNINPKAPVHSTRIRVGRNVESFGLSPGITKQQRLDIESAAKEAFCKLDDGLGGTYYPLLGMEEGVRQQMVDDHFLFMSGDKNLKASGMERDWPEGRGIFFNEDKNFLVWVNEEDQFRIISMQKGGNVLEVFKRLVKGIESMGRTIKEETGKDFIFSEKFGFIHSCPTNLGTGMRASVHIDFPGWTKEGLDALKKRCNELSLQPRGTRGESGGQTGVTYDISNKHRLGYTEVQLVQTMIDGVNKLYEEDLELQKKHEGETTTPSGFPEIKSKHSLVAKHVTEGKWKKLSDHKTETCGFTLAQAIACAVQFDDQHVGIYAGDGDCYVDFAEVFDPVIQEYHGVSDNFNHKSDLDASKITGNVNPNAPVHSTRIRVGRNVEGFGLSPGITKEQRLAIENAAKEAFKKLNDGLGGTYHPLLGMKEDVRKQMVDDHFLFMSGDKNLQASGMERDWPEGRGIFFNEDKNFLVWVNEEDQFRIISMQKGGDVLEVFKRLVKGIESMGTTVKEQTGREFMFNEKFGFIHSCPTNLGTGMRASVHIDLPGWNKEGLQALKKRCEELALQPRGTRGESGGQTGVTYDISNKHRLGYTEVQLVQTMIDGVNKLYEEDLELQKKHGVSAKGKQSGFCVVI